MVYLLGLLFIFGLVIGSFLNVVVFRTIYGESPLEGRSKCPHCHKTISWKHNIPLLSFFLLQGKCAYCHKKISWQYPVVEFLTGMLFVWWFLIGNSFFMLVGSPFTYIQPIFWLGVGILLLLVLVFDLWYGVIPNAINLLLFLWAIGYRMLLTVSGVMQGRDFINSILAGIILMTFFYGLYLLTKRRGFGLGDVKLAPSLGLILGDIGTLVAVFMAFVVGAVVGVFLIAIGKRKFGQTVPFGPFLVIGTLISLLWGNQLIAQYLSMLR